MSRRITNSDSRRPATVKETPMTSRLRMLATALAVSIIGLTAAARADDNPNAAADRNPASSTPATATTSPSTTDATPSTAATAPASISPSAGGSSAGAAAADASKDDSPARKIFDQLDTNHDGTLSFDEFARATFQQPK